MKPMNPAVCSSRFHVTPHTGVWIETLRVLTFFTRLTVTPHTGVWIETGNYGDPVLKPPGHPPYGGVD